ncbi:TIGR04282 family arsenosugar biosynthesis glycosyltransferase [Hymenobacter sp. ASUV-10]|uniref:TIGR04282 family arsenosugar biosynthesis glycosyltransferase n=1 Tax=Hymenobacter aranciens TaxID=3063996 RepID=A0ABT9BC96_9BACT|nr:TIGR04282 family arsenosugar biosynthesis glycosyltransferase [Hymenobacter sp. ASUV-10]MDO7875900.1 TIGR04282 family arsenosugar biosynthesis glycosyltransferase [Hymenobacter sp. ASUV-10]
MTKLSNGLSRHLIIFARQPVLGRVKTRLAADIGDTAALAVYRELLTITATAVGAAGIPATVWLADAPDLPTAELPEWPGLPWLLQPAGDLGHRMAAAFATAFVAGASAVAIIGTDCPGLRAAHLEQAFELLQHHDIVLGPATDGGYYLLAMKELHMLLFANKEWSTATVRAATLADAARLGLRVALLPQLADVDTVADLRAWRGE